MEKYYELLRGTSLILSHSLTMYILSDPSPRVRHPLRFWLVISAVLELFVLLLLFPLGKTSVVSGLMYFILLFAYCFALPYASSGPILRNLFIFLMYATYFMLAASMSNLISDAYFNGSEISIWVIRTMISALFIILLVWKLKAVFKKATDGIEEGWGTLFVFSLVSCLSVSGMAFAVYLYMPLGAHAMILAVSSIFVTAAFAVVIRMIGLLNEKGEMRLLRSQHRILEHELEAEDEFVETARRYRHDFRHHVALMREYAEAGDMDAMRRYLAEADADIERTKMPAWCQNKVVDSLIRISARRCAAAGISCSFSADVPEDLPLSGPELVALFGNLLENAVDGASKASEPSLRLDADIRNGVFFIEIRNSMSGDIIWNDNLPVSIKEGGGIGLRSVRNVVTNHHGMMRCFQDGGSFIVQIRIPL